MHPKNNEQLNALKAFAKEQGIDFETDKSIYDQACVKKILKGRQDVANGKGIKIAIEQLWN